MTWLPASSASFLQSLGGAGARRRGVASDEQLRSGRDGTRGAARRGPAARGVYFCSTTMVLTVAVTPSVTSTTTM
jgi:hypothetical protein